MDVLDRADLPFPHSLPEFQRLFPDDAACAAYLEKARWGDGFACPHCGTAGEPFHFENRPGVLRCRKCRQNTGLTVGTVMERSHTPLNVWFWAAYLVASQTPGMSAVQFQRQLGLSRYETAFQILHKLRSGMVRPNQDRIGGQPKNHVEVDETWVGGRTRGEGRGVHHNRSAKVALELMRDYAGGDPLHVDGYTVYDALGDPGRVSNPWDLAYCWVHWRRRFVEFQRGTASPVCEEILGRIAALSRIEAMVRGHPPEHRLSLGPTGTLDADRRGPAALGRSPACRRLSSASELARHIRYALKRSNGLSRLLHDRRIEMDTIPVGLHNALGDPGRVSNPWDLAYCGSTGGEGLWSSSAARRRPCARRYSDASRRCPG